MSTPATDKLRKTARKGAEDFDFATDEAVYDSMGRLVEDMDTHIDSEPDPGFVTDPIGEPDASFLDQKPRSKKAVQYEDKVRENLSFAFSLLVASPKTQPDAAAIVMHGPKMSEALGDLAAENAAVARGIDWLTEGTDNAALAVLSATLPFVYQIIRNHEPTVDVGPVRGRQIKLPFRKEPVTIRFRVRLRRLRAFTKDPQQLKAKVFGNSDMQAHLQEMGVEVNI